MIAREIIPDLTKQPDRITEARRLGAELPLRLREFGQAT